MRRGSRTEASNIREDPAATLTTGAGVVVVVVVVIWAVQLEYLHTNLMFPSSVSSQTFTCSRHLSPLSGSGAVQHRLNILHLRSMVIESSVNAMHSPVRLRDVGSHTGFLQGCARAAATRAAEAIRMWRDCMLLQV
ncbi:hypothetical protein PMAYCL1PPCAC_27117 [Pristionchus mayeri]|uniref:Uncharacterized protein n=1 Tax=Pristionchus mayeri TaxID=1317129 RepID=A0AAN5I8U9_9BILA|nr:hypothetical protein PMAYCL1PPCAC_27117 [Pristionchus mayeri]